jgi:hypothetical protein
MPKPNTPETPVAAPATPTDDETFASAFTEAIGEDTPKAPDAAAPAAPAVPAEPAAVAAAEPAAEPAAVPEEPETPAELAAEPVEEPEEAPEAKIARLEAENAALKAPKPPAPSAPPAPAETAPQGRETPPAGASEAPAAPQPPAEPAWYTPSDEEKTVLTDLEKNWPDIAAAQQVAIKQAVYNAVQYTFSQIQKTYNPALQRFADLSDVISEQLALSALRGEHADYDEVYDKVVQWVDTLPGPFKAGAKLTMTQGTPEEVAELITEYKKSHVTATPAASAPVAGKTELSAAAKQAASRLRVVGSKRTTPVAGADPNDFDAAWAEATRTGN